MSELPELNGAPVPSVTNLVTGAPLTPAPSRPAVTPERLEKAIHPHAKPAVLPFPAFYMKASLTFLGLGALGLSLVVYAILGSARVVVMAKPETINKEFAIDLSPKPGPEEVLGVATQCADTLERSFPVTESAGVKRLGRAVAKVKIASTMTVPQTLIEKTRLVTPTGVQFRLTGPVTVPARGSVETTALADDAGEKGQVGLATFTIPGLRPETRKLFTVTALEEPVAPEETATVEGTTEVPSGDVEAAASVLREDLTKSLSEALRAAAKAAGVPAGAKEIISFPDAKPEIKRAQGSDTFDAALKLAGTAVFYDETALTGVVKARLKKELPAEREIRSLDAKTMTVTVEKVETNGNATLRVRVTAEAALTAASPALAKTKLVGIKREAALQYLQALDGVNSADIVISPVWSSRLPSVASRIELEVR